MPPQQNPEGYVFLPEWSTAWAFAKKKYSSLCRAWEAYFKIFERGRTFNDEYFYVRMYLNRFGVP